MMEKAIGQKCDITMAHKELLTKKMTENKENCLTLHGQKHSKSNKYREWERFMQI